jgi:hypothetical protein
MIEGNAPSSVTHSQSGHWQEQLVDQHDAHKHTKVENMVQQSDRAVA